MAFTKRFTWSVTVSSFEKIKFGESITSRKFVTVMDHVCYTWCLKLYPKGLKINDSNYRNLYLSVVYLSGPKESVYAYNSCAVGTTINFCANSSQIGAECKINTGLLSLCISWKDIANFLNTADANGNVSLICVVNINLQPDLFANLPFPNIPEPAVFHSNDPLLLQVLSGDENKLSDFSIIAGEHVFATSRCILAARCPYFEQLFIEGGEDWIEKKSNQLSTPISKRAMAEILTYIYTDRVNIPRNDDGMVDVELIEELIGGADYFRLSELQKHYEHPLYDHLKANQSSENALSYFIFADRYGLKLLKNCALSILYDHLDWIEEHVRSVSGISAEAPNTGIASNEDEIVKMWKALKADRPNSFSLMDEIYAFSRQANITQL